MCFTCVGGWLSHQKPFGCGGFGTGAKPCAHVCHTAGLSWLVPVRATSTDVCKLLCQVQARCERLHNRRGACYSSTSAAASASASAKQPSVFPIYGCTCGLPSRMCGHPISFRQCGFWQAHHVAAAVATIRAVAVHDRDAYICGWHQWLPGLSFSFNGSGRHRSLCFVMPNISPRHTIGRVIHHHSGAAHEIRWCYAHAPQLPTGAAGH
jgi:hypothetical protein